MKKLLIVFALLCMTFFAGAQDNVDPIFVKGDKVANIGLGLGAGLGSHYKMLIPAISLSGEYGIADGILEKGSVGVGAYLGFASYKYSGWVYSYSYKTTRVYVGPRGSFHYPLVEKLDTYAGLSFGLRLYNKSYDDDYDETIYGSPNDDSGVGVYSYWFVGARYYLTDNLAAMAELGYGITYLNIGISFRL